MHTWWHELLLQQHASKFSQCPLTSGLRLFTVTMPMWDYAIPHQPQFKKNKEITAAWFSSCVLCTLQFSIGWLQACWPSDMFSTVLVLKRGDRVTSVYCFVTQTRPQTVNNPMEKELSLHRANTPLTLKSVFLRIIMRHWAERRVQEVKLMVMVITCGYCAKHQQWRLIWSRADHVQQQLRF